MPKSLQVDVEGSNTLLDDDVADIRQKAQFYREYLKLSDSEADDFRKQLEQTHQANQSIYAKLIEESNSLKLQRLQQLTAQYESLKRSMKEKRDELVRVSQMRKSLHKQSIQEKLNQLKSEASSAEESPAENMKLSVDLVENEKLV